MRERLAILNVTETYAYYTISGKYTALCRLWSLQLKKIVQGFSP